MPVIPANYALVVLTWQNTSFNLEFHTTLGTEVDDLINPTDQDAASNVWRDAMKPLVDSGWTLGPTTWYWRTDTGAPLEVYVDTTTEIGTHTVEDYLPPHSAANVRKLTGFAGQKFRGRNLVPAVPETGVDDAGGLTAGTINAYNSAFSSLLTGWTALSATVGNLVLLHSSSVTDPTPITQFVCQPKVATIRKRM